MKLIIDIPDEIYNHLLYCKVNYIKVNYISGIKNGFVDKMLYAIANGKPIDKLTDDRG